MVPIIGYLMDIEHYFFRGTNQQQIRVLWIFMEELGM